MIAALTFYSCQQDDPAVIQETPELSKVPTEIDEQFEYARQHLTTVGLAALRLSRDQSIKQTIYSEVEKQFDGDYNVLFESLLSETMNLEENPNSRITSAMSEEDYSSVLDALQAFKGIDGEDFYPQIYIPYYETLEEQGVSAGSRLASSESNPIVVIYDGDESQTEWTGYRLNVANELEDVGFPITVEYAENNEVWVISINERTGSEIIDSDYSGEYTGARVSANTQLVKFENIRVHCRKEGGLAGKTDLSIIRLTTWYDTKNPSTDETQWNCHYDCNSSGGIEHTGTVFKQWKKSQIGDQKTVNWRFWDKNSDNGDYMCFVLFEKDGWPNGTKDILFHPSGSTSAIGSRIVAYRSSEKAYAYANLAYFNAQTTFNRDFYVSSLGEVFDRCIEFNTLYDY